MKRAVYITFILILTVMFSLILFACNKNEHTHKWGGWYDNGDGTHMRMCLTDSEHVEYAPHEFSDCVVRKDPTDILPGEQMRTCKSCGYTETEVIPPTGDHVFDKEIKDDKYLYKKTSDYSAIYYKSCDCGAFGNPDYLFEDTLLPDGYSDLEYVSVDWDGGIDTGIEYGQGVSVQYNVCKVRNANLPEEYLQVDYIETDGKAYLDLEYRETDSTTVDCDFFVVNAVRNYLFGSSQINSCMFNGLYSNNSFEYNFQEYLFTPADRVLMTQSLKGDKLTFNINGTTQTVEKGTSNNAEMYLFACNDGSRPYGVRLKCYMFRIYEDGIIKRDMIPCIKTADYEVGMYDLVNGKFYENAGEGGFSAGEVLSENKELFVENVALPSGYTRTDKITSYGEQYIDTGLCLKSGDVIITEFENTSGYIIGQNWQGGSNPYWQISGNAGSHLIDFSDKKVGDAHIYTFNSVPDNMQATIGLFCTYCIDAPVAYGTGSIYYFQLIRDGEKLMSLVPAVNDKNEVGFFDVVGNLFYTNQGSGNLGCGDKINPRFNESTYALYYIDADGKKVDTAVVMASDQDSFKEKYVRCEYIECDGNQWFDTGVVGQAKWIFDVQYTNTTERQLMGHGGTSGEYWGVTDGKYGKATWSSSAVLIGNRDVVQVNNFVGTQPAGIGGYVYVNGEFAVDNKYDSKSEENSAILFAIGDGRFSSCCRLWGCQVYDKDNNLIRNFIPCVRKSDGVAGLYDDVSGEFFKSEGTADFIPGGQIETSNNVVIGYEYKYSVAKYRRTNIYDVVITTDDVTMHLIPALRNSDGQIGMYDIINGAFYSPENNDKIKASMPVTHIFGADIILKEATYSEDGLLMRKCRICGAEIYETIPKTAFKIEFACDEGIENIKVMNSLDINDYQISNVAYSRNIYSYNYSKFNAGALIIIDLKEGYRLNSILSDIDGVIIMPYGNGSMVIANISCDIKVTISSYKQ